MNIEDFKKNLEKFKGKIYFDHNLSKLNWFNIGGTAKIFFKPMNLQDLISFLNFYRNRGKIFILGAGSNILFKDESYEGVVIKLTKNFSNISILNENTIVAGSGVLDRTISEFAMNNNIGGLEFLSCIPGTIGGAIRMNSGCFGKEIKDILISVQVLDKTGKVRTIPYNNINFSYRKCDLPKDLIFLSASFKGEYKEKKKIEEEIVYLKNKKEMSQPTQVKTGGSTFKNPEQKKGLKVWELIKQSVPSDLTFGDATISPKHSNFLINKGHATYSDMKKLIDFISVSVKDKTGVKIDLEIIIVD